MDLIRTLHIQYFDSLSFPQGLAAASQLPVAVGCTVVGGTAGVAENGWQLGAAALIKLERCRECMNVWGVCVYVCVCVNIPVVCG